MKSLVFGLKRRDFLILTELALKLKFGFWLNWFEFGTELTAFLSRRDEGNDCCFKQMECEYEIQRTNFEILRISICCMNFINYLSLQLVQLVQLSQDTSEKCLAACSLTKKRFWPSPKNCLSFLKICPKNCFAFV